MRDLSNPHGIRAMSATCCALPENCQVKALRCSALSTLLVMVVLASIIGCGRSISERWRRSQHDQLGFRLADGKPVYRTNNPEPLAPDWDEPVNADPGSFKSLFTPANAAASFPYACDAKKVFIGVGKRVYELRNADPATIRILDQHGYFSADANHVYYIGFPLPEADAGSFEVVSTHYGKDKSSVFFGPLPVAGATPQHFMVLSEGEMSLVNVDHSGAGPHRDVAFHEKRGEVEYAGFWAKDDAACFYGPRQLKDADAQTFRVMNSKTAEDKNWRFVEEGINSLKQFEISNGRRVRSTK